MTKFICSNLISGKLTWAKVETSKTYSVYKDDVLVVLDEMGFMIEDGKCVPKPVESDDD